LNKTSKVIERALNTESSDIFGAFFEEDDKDN
jgi:hypothetical protein